ncbi:MAG: hypothetical protein GY868_01475 [Deltaproteobacteria bacterium]|nr:hypothetical protein [Deltaproteobacteria bacterium]
MKKKLTFLVITSRTGTQRRFSMSKNSLVVFFVAAGLLLTSGFVGAWKYRENIQLRKTSLLLEAEKGQMEAVARTVARIKSEEVQIKELLGLDNSAMQPDQKK